MEIKYGVTGKDRKALVSAIAEIIGAKAIYKGVPTCNYEVDYFTIDKSGTLIFDDSADSEEVEHLLEELAIQGFVAEQAESEGETIDNGFSVSLPIEKVNVFNLQNLKNPEERYQFRRLCRSLIRWYSYLTQVVRMFDKDMHKEYLFLSYLIGLLPVEQEDPVDLDGKLKLEYYKLQKTFEGAIQLENMDGQYVPSKQKGVQGKRVKSTLDEILEKINEKFKGDFTDGDKVMLGALHDKLMGDEKLASSARTSDPRIFTESIFPAAFGTAAMDSYMEAQDSYSSLFEDKNKYNAIMGALAGVIYREMRSKEPTAV